VPAGAHLRSPFEWLVCVIRIERFSRFVILMQINMGTVYSRIIPHNQAKAKEIIMSNSLANKVQHNVQDALDDVARSL
jgi:hypothetical protein